VADAYHARYQPGNADVIHDHGACCLGQRYVAGTQVRDSRALSLRDINYLPRRSSDRSIAFKRCQSRIEHGEQSGPPRQMPPQCCQPRFSGISAETVDLLQEGPGIVRNFGWGLESGQFRPGRRRGRRRIIRRGAGGRHNQSRERHQVHTVGAVIGGNQSPDSRQVCLGHAGAGKLTRGRRLRHGQQHSLRSIRSLRSLTQLQERGHRLTCLEKRLGRLPGGWQSAFDARQGPPYRGNQRNLHGLADIGKNSSGFPRRLGLGDRRNRIVAFGSVHL